MLYLMRDFRTLRVWEAAHRLVLLVYQTTGAFPKEEMYGLTSQVRRSAPSIPANIAEGCGRNGEAELARFFDIAMGSASELEYHLLLARDLRFLNETNYQLLTTEVISLKRMLGTFIRTLRTSTRRLPPTNRGRRLTADSRKPDS
jgi:four helix bundle protein